MNLKIRMEFYLKNGQVLADQLIFGKSSEKVTNEDFIKDVEEKLFSEREKINEKFIIGSNEIYQFANSFIKFSEIAGYRSFIEMVEPDSNEFYDNYENNIEDEKEEENSIIIRDFDEEKQD